MAISITLTVNDEPRTFNGDLSMPLLWFLRDELHLTGTKFGCGVSLCGACTVHVDGKATRACVTPMSEVADASITTIEGASGKAVQALQEAWIELDVPQCGYCQTGQIMQAAELLATNAAPTDADIDTAMDGNVCRCATYQRVRAGIHRASELMEG